MDRGLTPGRASSLQPNISQLMEVIMVLRFSICCSVKEASLAV